MADYTDADLARIRQARARPERTIQDDRSSITLKSDAELRQAEADILRAGRRALGLAPRRRVRIVACKDL